MGGPYGNWGIDRPVISRVIRNKSSGTLVIEGFAMPGVFLEFYLKRGNRYLYQYTRREGGTVDGVSDKAYDSGQYTDPVSRQRIVQNRFQFTEALSNFNANDEILAIATDSEGNTSEFSESVMVQTSGGLKVTVWKDANNDGIKNDHEPPLSGIAVRLFRIDDKEQQTLVNTQKTDSRGEIAFSSLAPANYAVTVIDGQPALSGLMPQDKTPAYQRFELKAGATIPVWFGYIEGLSELMLTPDHRRSVMPGTRVSFIHTLKSSVAGRFELTPTWSDGHNNLVDIDKRWPVILKKFNCDATPEAGQVINNNQLTIQSVAGKPVEAVCLEASFFVPANTAYGLTRSLNLTAELLSEDSSADGASNTGKSNEKISAIAIDHITVTDQDAGKLVLSKWVTLVSSGEDQGKKTTSNKAGPGDTLQYTIGYTNTGTAPISEVSIIDQIPPFTALSKELSCESPDASLPKSISCAATFDKKTVGYQGQLEWSFDGKLQPGESGEVSYQVKIE